MNCLQTVNSFHAEVKNRTQILLSVPCLVFFWNGQTTFLIGQLCHTPHLLYIYDLQIVQTTFGFGLKQSFGLCLSQNLLHLLADICEELVGFLGIL